MPRVLLLLGLLLATVAADHPAVAQEATAFWWRRAETRSIGRYQVRSDLRPDDANALAQHLNVMYEEYARRLGALPPRVPEELNVLMFRHRNDYEFTLRILYGIDAANTGGMFFVTPEVKALAFWTEGLSERRVHHVVQHEAFHQYAYFRFGSDLPLWVNEGLAELFGQAVLVDGAFILGQATPRIIERIHDLLELGAWVPFRDMLNMTPEQWRERLGRGDGRTLYPQSWSMVHFLIARYSDLFERYLLLINRGDRPELAFSKAFGADITPFETEWTAHAKAARPSAFVTALERIEFLATGMLHVRRDGARPESLAALREAMQAGDYRQTLQRHTADVTLSAADDENYRIPADVLTREPPRFIVERNRRIPLHERGLEPKNPRPAVIRTENLRPYELRVEWVRDMDTNTFGYRVVIEAPK